MTGTVIQDDMPSFFSHSNYATFKLESNSEGRRLGIKVFVLRTVCSVNLTGENRGGLGDMVSNAVYFYLCKKPHGRNTLIASDFLQVWNHTSVGG